MFLEAQSQGQLSYTTNYAPSNKIRVFEGRESSDDTTLLKIYGILNCPQQSAS